MEKTTRQMTHSPEWAPAGLGLDPFLRICEILAIDGKEDCSPLPNDAVGLGKAHERNSGNGWPRARKPAFPSPLALVMANSRLCNRYDSFGCYRADEGALERMATFRRGARPRRSPPPS